MGGPENDKWVLSIAQNQNEPSQLRSMAISRLIRSNISIADLNKLYDSADSYNVRSQIINVLANRKEPEATDKLIDIVKNGTVVQLRTQAINALTRKNDPRSVAAAQRTFSTERSHDAPQPSSRRRRARRGGRSGGIRAGARRSRRPRRPTGACSSASPSRPGVCGNGRTYIQTGPNSYSGTFYGNFSDGMRADPCVAGPVRVVIDRADKLPLSVQTYVGPPDSTLRGVTDLGHVRAQDAADYLLSLASKIDGRAGREALHAGDARRQREHRGDARRDRAQHVAAARDAPQRAQLHGPLHRRHADDSVERHRSDPRHRPRRIRQPVGAPGRAVGARPPRPRRRHSAAHPALAADAEQLAGEGIDVRRSPTPAIRARASICERPCGAPICPRTCSRSRCARSASSTPRRRTPRCSASSIRRSRPTGRAKRCFRR